MFFETIPADANLMTYLWMVFANSWGVIALILTLIYVFTAFHIVAVAAAIGLAISTVVYFATDQSGNAFVISAMICAGIILIPPAAAAAVLALFAVYYFWLFDYIQFFFWDDGIKIVLGLLPLAILIPVALMISTLAGQGGSSSDDSEGWSYGDDYTPEPESAPRKSIWSGMGQGIASSSKTTPPSWERTPAAKPEQKKQTFAKPQERPQYFVERMGPGQQKFQKVTGGNSNMATAQRRQEQAERAYQGTDSLTGNASKAKYRIVDKNGKVQ